MSDLTPITSPTDIEEAIEAHLVNHVEAIRKTVNQRDLRYVFTNPAITVAILKATAQPTARRAFRFDCIVNILVTFTSAKSEEARRKGINPIIMAILSAATRQKFGLDISELKPTGFSEITDEKDYQENKIVYLLEFATYFYWQGEDEEQALDLLRVGLSYFLQDPTDDGTADATDLVELEQA